MDIQRKILYAYSSGEKIKSIARSLDITHKEVLDYINDYKEETSPQGNRISEDLKVIIAERDMHGVKRKDIAEELELNISTIRRACAKYGDTKKRIDLTQDDDDSNEKKYEFHSKGEINGNCPECNDRRLRKVDDDFYYCMDCSNEFKEVNGFIYQVNWDLYI